MAMEGAELRDTSHKPCVFIALHSFLPSILLFNHSTLQIIVTYLLEALCELKIIA